MDVKLEALQMAPVELFNAFSSEEWMTVRESRFTKPLDKLTTFRGDVSDVGDEPNIDKADAWISGLIAGENLMKGHREYLKAKDKHAKFLDLAPSVKNFSDFLLKNEVDLSKSFRLFRFRAIFWLSFEAKDLNELLSLLLDDGLASVARSPLPVIEEGAAVANPNPKSICVCAWLPSVLLKALGLQVISFDMENFQANLEQLASTIEASFKVLSGSEALAKSCKEVVDDLKQYWIFLSAAKERPEVRATAAKLALEYLQQEALKKFYLPGVRVRPASPVRGEAAYPDLVEG
jgi:hypothetical protein